MFEVAETAMSAAILSLAVCDVMDKVGIPLGTTVYYIMSQSFSALCW